MFVLKVEYKKKTLVESKLVWAHVPQQMADYLTLYCLAHGSPKSIVVRNAIQGWYDKQTETEEELIKLLIKRAKEQQKKLAKSSIFHIGLFKRKLGIDLKHKGVRKKLFSQKI